MSGNYDATMIERAMKELEQPSGAEDAGNRAREALKRRAQQAKRAMFNLYLIVTTFVTIFVIGLGAFTYTEFQKTSKWVTDARPCRFVDPKTEQEITGTREYNYQSKSIFGIDYRMSDQVEVKTKLDLKGEVMNITGISNEGWWSVYSDLGERGVLLLKPASLYVFAMGKNTYVFQDKDFCR